MVIKENGPGLTVQQVGPAGPRTVGPLKPVLKSNKLSIVTNKIKPFNLYINNRSKYIIINNDKKHVAY